MKFKSFCEELDKISRVDLGFRGVVDKLYNVLRARIGKPLTHAVAELIGYVRPQRVMIVTGFKVLPRMVQETDGPPGALVLAQTLKILGVDVSLAIEEDQVEVLKAGLEVLKLDCPVVPLPFNTSLKEFSRTVLNELKPDLLIFVEKAGANEVGVYHTMLGVDVSRHHAKVEDLLEEARERGCKVISIGDGGNEVGFGFVEEVKKLIPRGEDCGCPCRRGVAAASRADLVMVSSVSNVGCYVISCALSALKGLPWPHDSTVEIELLKSMVDAGAVDGMSGERLMKVDGVPANILTSIIDVLSYMTRRYVKEEGDGAQP